MQDSWEDQPDLMADRTFPAKNEIYPSIYLSILVKHLYFHYTLQL